MDRRLTFVGIIVVAVAAGYFLFVREPQDSSRDFTPSPTPDAESQIEELLNTQIPEDAQRANLGVVEDATIEANGIGTRQEDGTVSILADLPEPDDAFYQGWVEKGREGDDEHQLVSLGQLSQVKGGWRVTTQLDNAEDFERVVVSLESSIDATIENRLLEGSF